jgi:hypothetical protein
MIVDNPGVENKNTDRDTGGAAHTGEVVANSDPDDVPISQGDDHLAITTSTSFSPEITKSDSATTLDDKRQLNPSIQGDPIPSPSNKRSRSLSGSGQVDDHGSDWVFDVFTEDDSGTKGDGSPPLKRARSFPPPFKAAKNRPLPAASVAVKGVQVPGSAHGDRPPRGDQEYEVHQIVSESGLEYEVTAVTKIWLPKALVGPKLVRKYQTEQSAATWIRTRWSSRLQNKN